MPQSLGFPHVGPGWFAEGGEYSFVAQGGCYTRRCQTGLCIKRGSIDNRCLTRTARQTGIHRDPTDNARTDKHRISARTDKHRISGYS